MQLDPEEKKRQEDLRAFAKALQGGQLPAASESIENQYPRAMLDQIGKSVDFDTLKSRALSDEDRFKKQLMTGSDPAYRNRPEEPGLQDEGYFDAVKPYKEALLARSSMPEYAKDMANFLIPDDPLDLFMMAKNAAVAGNSAMRNIGDVIDFKKMKDKKLRERLLKGDLDDPPRYSGEKLKRTKEEVHADMQRKIKEREERGGNVNNNLGKLSKEAMAENNMRAMEEAGLQRGKQSTLGAQRETQGNVTSIDGRPIQPQVRSEDIPYTPEQALERVKARFGGEDYLESAPRDHTMRLIQKVEKNGADEPYVGRDYSGAIAVRNPKTNQILQPIPVPPSKIGDLKGVLGKGVLTGDSDPFGWMDTKYGVSKALLERENDKPLKIFTRSDLIAHDDYLERLNPAKHEVNIVFSTPNDQVGRLIEPGAPSLKRRITAANRLADQGVPVRLHYQQFDNKNLPDSWQQFQPSEFELLKDLRERGLNPSVKITIDRTPIQDRNVKELIKVLGLSPNGKKD